MIPNHLVSSNIQRRLVETGTLKKNIGNGEGKPRTVRTPQIEEAILNKIEEHSDSSIRKSVNIKILVN